jgi:hypothetical protein
MAYKQPKSITAFYAPVMLLLSFVFVVTTLTLGRHVFMSVSDLVLIASGAAAVPAITFFSLWIFPAVVNHIPFLRRRLWDWIDYESAPLSDKMEVLYISFVAATVVGFFVSSWIG